VSVRNCVDWALLARSVDSQWKGPYKGGIGLSRLAETYLERKLPKGGIQRSNWEIELSTLQQECEWHHPFLPREKSLVPTSDVRFGVHFLDAANDSHASLTIHRVLEQRAQEIIPVPEPEWFTFDSVQGILRDNEGRPWFPYNPRYDPGLPCSPSTVDSGTGTACAEK
jgi:hypothetical protein